MVNVIIGFSCLAHFPFCNMNNLEAISVDNTPLQEVLFTISSKFHETGTTYISKILYLVYNAVKVLQDWWH